MSRDLPRGQYASSFGPTTGDRVHLADTGLIVEVEDNAVTYGDETRYGGGRTVRDGLGMKADATAAEGALDWVITNTVVIDPVVGITKGDIGIKDGRIVGVGSAGNTDIMAGVDTDLEVSPNTDVYPGEGLIATPGALDTHVHFNNPELVEHALSTGVTTMLGGGYGGESTTCTPGKRNLEYFIKASESWPVNVGFYGKGNASRSQVLREQIEWGACGHKIHEDWGATPAVIDTCLDVADEMDVQVCLHADTLNEMGFVEDTFDAIDGRTIHMFHAEGAGGGHAPDILELVGQPNMLPSSTNPTMPYTTNSLDELQDMTLVAHNLDRNDPEDVAFADSRTRGETIAAEDVLHDLGALSIMTTDALAMGRMGELLSRTWQTAGKMKQQRGSLPADDDTENDNVRIKRYIAKYTINPAIASGIDTHVGSLEAGKLADIVLWKPAFFGIKPELVMKGGFPVRSNTGEANGSITTCQPMRLRARSGSHGKAPAALSVLFTSKAAVENDIGDRYGLDRPLVPVQGTRNPSKEHMRYNDYCPDDITVDPETFEVRIDGEHITCDPADDVPLAQRYMF
jgi:urease subunit alpha